MNTDDRPTLNPGADAAASGATSLGILSGIFGDGARAALGALSAAGWVCVPRCPTNAMIESARDSAESENAADVWRNMIEEIERSSS